MPDPDLWRAELFEDERVLLTESHVEACSESRCQRPHSRKNIRIVHAASTTANMAALSAKRRVFDSVFASQPYTSVDQSHQPNDQAQWNRSWRIVTEALNLPHMPNARALDAFSLPPPDRVLDEASKDLLYPATRLPQASQTPDIIIWYTNQVRRHYLNQVFPNIQRLRTMLDPDETPSPDTWAKKCIQILKCAHRLYAEGLGILIRSLTDAPAVVKNFRLNLSTIVSNSISDRSCIRAVIRRHVSRILNDSEPEADFLGLVKSLSDVGLGGEKYVCGLSSAPSFVANSHFRECILGIGCPTQSSQCLRSSISFRQF